MAQSRKRRRNNLTPSQREVARDRFGLPDYNPSSTSPPKDMNDVMETVIGRMGLKRKFWEHDLLEQWTRIAGKDLSRHARPGAVEHGKLIVYVDHPIWMMQLKGKADKQLLANLKKAFPDKPLRGIRWLIDPDQHGR